MSSFNFNNLCLGCMSTLPHPQAVCQKCGWSRNTSQNLLTQLKQGSLLKNTATGNEYLIGKAKGNGGFGIVYIAWDIANNRRVAIKEYFPTSIVGRDQSNTVVLLNDTPNNKNFFEKQKHRFHQEAEKMQMFSDSKSVVNVLDFFEANNTSYIVMEFIEGQTFTEVLNNQPNKRMPLKVVLPNLASLVDILERIHHTPWKDDNGILHQGIIHRDISPENIMFDGVNGTVKLLDFGAARVSDPHDPLTGIYKPGYAAYEQEVSTGLYAASQGSWTDVYAFAATIYRAITGQIPVGATQRSIQDTLALPSNMGIEITPKAEQVLLKGMAIKYIDRYQSVRQFYDDLVNSEEPVEKNHPTLTVGEFTKNGDNYTAVIQYNGDGILSSTVGIINGNILMIQNPSGNINGTLTASEGTHFYAATQYFELTPDNSLIRKIAWAIAVVALIVAFLMHSKLSTAEGKLLDIQNHIKSNDEQMEKYHSFAADYGYASSSYYSEKAIVFVNRNSEEKFRIYYDVNGTASFDVIAQDNGIVTVRTDQDSFDENHKAEIIVKAGDTPGYATIKFTNTANSETFDVLAVVQ